MSLGFLFFFEVEGPPKSSTVNAPLKCTIYATILYRKSVFIFSVRLANDTCDHGLQRSSKAAGLTKIEVLFLR